MSKKSWNNGTRQLEVLAEGIYKRGRGVAGTLGAAEQGERVDRAGRAMGPDSKEDEVSKQETGPIDPEDPTKVVGGIEDAEGESLADHFLKFASKVSAAEEGRDVSIDELRLELNALDEKLEALGRG
jgi:hypothetical protein